MTETEKPQSKTILSNLLVLFVIICILIALFEIAVRIVVPQNLEKTVPGLYELSDKLGHRMVPHYSETLSKAEYTSLIQINSMGFRDREYGEKSEEALRIMVLGDSFLVSMGVQYEEMFTTRLEDMLNEQYGAERVIEVVNAASDGYSPYQYLLMLQEKGHEIKPDIVLVAFYIGNDFHPRKVRHKGIRSEKLSVGKRKFSLKKDVLYPANDFLESHSHAFLFLRVRLDNLLWKLGLRPYEFHNIFKKQWSPTIAEYWTDTRQTLLELRDYSVNDLGAEFGVVIIPAIYQVYDDFWERNLEFFKVAPEAVDRDRPNRVLQSFLEDNGIKYLDLRGGLASGSSDGLLYYPIDRHWNSAGNELASELASSFISSNYLN